MKNVIFALSMMGFMSCQYEVVEKVCLPPPCGDIESSKFNISFIYEDDPSDKIASTAFWVVGESSEELSLDGDGNGVSCWNQTALFPSELDVNKIVYTKNEVETEILVDANTLQTSAIRVEILNSGNNYYDWGAECLDTPSN